MKRKLNGILILIIGIILGVTGIMGMVIFPINYILCGIGGITVGVGLVKLLWPETMDIDNFDDGI